MNKVLPRSWAYSASPEGRVPWRAIEFYPSGLWVTNSTKYDTILLRDFYVLNRFVEESESKLQVRCSLVSADHAEIEFLSDPHVKNGTSLGKLYLEKSTPVSRTWYHIFF